MPSLEDLRAQLVQRVRTAQDERRQAKLVQSDCDHDWQRFRQTVVPDVKPDWHAKLPGARAFVGTAYFIVRGCTKCKRKEFIDYRVIGASV